jgi:hypothetical protein
MPGLIIGKTFAWPGFRRLGARFYTPTASFSEKCDQSPHLLIFLRSKTRLKPAKSPIDSLHRLLCLFVDCGAGRSTLSNIELVTTFSDETNWSSNTIGSLVAVVAMTLVSNRSNRRERLLLIIIVVCHKSRKVGPRSVKALARSAQLSSPRWSSFPVV